MKNSNNGMQSNAKSSGVKMKMKKKSLMIWGTATVLAVTVIGCTKSRDYETVYKNNVWSDSLVDQNAEYLYTVSVIDAPRSVDATMPGYLADPKIVKFRFTEKNLEAIEPDMDERFKNNPANEKPVLAIPVTHVEYRCADNGAGECSNKEEENNDIHWTQKSQFKADPDGVTVREISHLPLELDALFGGCYSEIGSRTVGFDVQSDVINIEQEKTFRANPDCQADIESLSDLTFKANYHYSFIKRDKLISKDYKAVKYPETDENTFGFFTSVQNNLSVDYRPEESGRQVLMNRWNPERKSIVYHMSENMGKPEYAAVRDASRQAFVAVNNALKAAGVDIKVELKDPSPVKVGDLRTNSIFMIEDPQATGVIGYGPSTADPRTGEILSARVVFYYGTMKKIIRSTWDEYVERENAAKLATTAVVASVSPSSAVGSLARVSPVMTDKVKDAKVAQYLEKLHSKLPADIALKQQALKELRHNHNHNQAKVEALTRMGPKQIEKIIAKIGRENVTDMENARKLLDDDSDGAKKQASFERRTEALAKYNVYPGEYLNVDGAIKLASLKELKSMPLKPWLELDDAQKDRLINVILPYIWVSTLVHEVGHNLGLRHNFAGSEDKANFYTPAEVNSFASEGTENPMTFSSVMDYGYSSLNDLHVMGKYDIAALRYGYKREVETADGQIVKLAPKEAISAFGVKTVEEGTLANNPSVQAKLKPYKFCTDENVGINPGCRRFDAGTNYTEIATHIAEQYEESYARTNFRNGRRNFSLMDDMAYLRRVYGTFMDLRPFYEIYERFTVEYGFPEGTDWKAIDPTGKLVPASTKEFWADIVGAMNVARSTMFSPLLTPDLMCGLVADGAAPVFNPTLDPKTGDVVKEANVEWKRLEEITQGEIYANCFHAEVKANAARSKKTVVAQTGKAFNSGKFADAEGSYVSYVDQIDVRGIWADKVAAALMLTSRYTGVSSFDNINGNVLDSTPGSAQLMANIMDGYLLDGLNVGTVAKLEDGRMTRIKNLSFRPFANHMIASNYSRGIRGLLGAAPGETTPFSQVLSAIVLGNMKDVVPNGLTDAFRLRYGIANSATKLDRDAKEYDALDIGRYRYYMNENNSFAQDVVQQMTIVTILDKVKKDRLPKVFEEAMRRAFANFAPAPNQDPSVVPAPGNVGQGPNEGQAGQVAPAPAAPAETFSAEEEAAIKLGYEAIDAYAAGQFRSTAYLGHVLHMLDLANSQVSY